MKKFLVFLCVFSFPGIDLLFASTTNTNCCILNEPTFSCPAVISPVGPLCDGTADIELTASPAGGTWSGPGIVTSNGVFQTRLGEYWKQCDYF
ncbi:MAG: hypothetical protein IPP15_16265 [Saprospiraceae bacterium]|uniref:Secreted protein n=1 Tax=Candidatus Opimibacter skivensis TaxID=2982028 RepID=A0A9D7SV73_9BACT|nr:hypothetical protein [Candidatus Opimibacter skivensis]